MSRNRFYIVLVEDAEPDVILVREALEQSGLEFDLRVFDDGEQGVDFVENMDRDASVTRPHLFLLDLNLPKKDGREVLEEIKESDALKSIPVVILTTSASDADVLRSYKLHANCYITKPVGLDGFLNVVKSIDSFWLSVVRLPHEARS